MTYLTANQQLASTPQTYIDQDKVYQFTYTTGTLVYTLPEAVKSLIEVVALQVVGTSTPTQTSDALHGNVFHLLNTSTQVVTAASTINGITSGTATKEVAAVSGGLDVTVMCTVNGLSPISVDYTYVLLLTGAVLNTAGTALDLSACPTLPNGTVVTVLYTASTRPLIHP